MGRAEAIDYSGFDHKRRQVIALGVPSLGMVPLRWVKSFYEMRMPTNRGVVHIYCEGKEVGDARNDIVQRALDWQAQRPDTEMLGVFFLDDDVLPHPEALVKLMAHQRPIISGLYFMKYQVPTPLVLMDEGHGVVSWRPGEVVECAAHGMGLTYIALEVFQRLRDETDLGVDQFGNPAWFKTLKDEHVLDARGQRIIANYTEDVYFLKRAQALGYQPAVDTSAQAFGWHWHQRERRAYPIKQWAEWTEKGTITWDADNGQSVVWGSEMAVVA